MDKELQDDMLKLVRYKLLFVRREYEHAFPEREDLVSDNLDGTAFSAWKTAEFIQELGRKETRVPDKWRTKNYPGKESAFVEERNAQLYLKGLPDDDKKYLRVYYEVLDRYPREKFKFEEQKIRILEDIRDNLKRKPRHFERLAKLYETNAARLKYLRLAFRACAEKLSGPISDALMKYRETGAVVAIAVTPEELKEAFRRGAAPLKGLKPTELDEFAGKWEGINREYLRETGKDVTAGATPWYMVWGKGTEEDGQYTQTVVGSKSRHIEVGELPGVDKKQVDLALNVHREDVGLTGWLSTMVEFPSEMPLVAYHFKPGTFLWIGQVLDKELKAAEFPDETGKLVGGEKLYWMFLEWIDDAKKNYYMYGLQFEINFDDCSAKLFGKSVRKTQFTRKA